MNYKFNEDDDHSKSPNREEVGLIKGSIEGHMTEDQILNKRAFVWGFGKNQEGELSLGVYKDALLPRFVNGLKG